MGNLDKRFLITVNLNDSSVDIINESMKFYNTDKNIANLYIKINDDRDGFTKYVPKSDSSKYQVKITVIKPKTKMFRELIGIPSDDLNSETCAIYKFELPNEFTDQIGDVYCETTVTSGDEELTADYFQYTVKSSKLTGLNAEIIANPDLPVLKSLMQDVRDTMTELTKEVQKVNYIDNVNITDTNTYSNKKIEEKFSTVNAQFQTIEQDFNSQLAETQSQFNQVVGAVTEDSEVVLARSEYTTLKERLDAEKAEFSAHKDNYATRLKGELGDEHIIRELPNGARDEFNIGENKIIKRVSNKLPIPNVSSVINGANMTRAIIAGTSFDNKADWESESSGWKNVVVYNKDGSIKETIPTSSYDDVSAIGKYYLHPNQGIYFIMPLGTTNVQADELLKETTITYELKTPINVPLPSTMTPNTQYLLELLSGNKTGLDGLLVSENEEWGV